MFVHYQEVSMRGRPVVSLVIAAAARLAGLGLALFFGLVSPVAAQTAAPAALRGVVQDSSGGAIPGAVIQLSTSSGPRSTVSDHDGRFTFERLPADGGRLEVSFDGFLPYATPVKAGQRQIRIVLQPLPLNESVVVRGVLPRVASATRTDTPARDVPQSVSIVTRQQIAEQGMLGIADVVAYVPGVGMAQGEGHRDAPIFRGNTSTSDFFVDGLRDDTQYLRDLYNVERVEVLKGPNGMLFGRGGAGGVINRVTRQAGFQPTQEFTVQTGSFDRQRVSLDVGHTLGSRAAVRATGMFEDAGSYRAGVGLQRFGFHPTLTLSLGRNTTLRAGYERFRDERTTDRGIPSFDGRPLDIDPSTFFGSVLANTTDVTVDAVSATVEHGFGKGFKLRSQLRYAAYDKFYQNLVPGAVSADRASTTLSGYSNRTERHNFFSQNDFVFASQTGRIRHSWLAGVEVGRQATDNRRLTAYFPLLGGNATSLTVPLSAPTTSAPIEFRAAASDATNDGVATVTALYFQDDIALSARVHAIVGLRYDQFAVELLDRRDGSILTTSDALLSPRLGLVYKPWLPLSLYTSYSRSHLPRAGEQLASLSASTASLAPENFRNLEAGVKWDVAPSLSVSTAVYRLDHGNVFVRDPLDPTSARLADAERTTGVEVEISGTLLQNWRMHGGYTYQDGEVTQPLSATVAAGARLAQVPRHGFSLWNRYDVSPRWGLGLGVIARDDSFAATDNRVVLPGFTRVDGALFLTITPRLSAQVNVENVFDARYFASAHNNNNILPGAPRALRLNLSARF